MNLYENTQADLISHLDIFGVSNKSETSFFSFCCFKFLLAFSFSLLLPQGLICKALKFENVGGMLFCDLLRSEGLIVTRKN